MFNWFNFSVEYIYAEPLTGTSEYVVNVAVIRFVIVVVPIVPLKLLVSAMLPIVVPLAGTVPCKKYAPSE